MNIALFAILGALVGWALTPVLPSGERRLSIIAGVVTGIVGALLGGWLLGPLFHTSPAHENGIATTASLVSMLGATLSCGLVSLTSDYLSTMHSVPCLRNPFSQRQSLPE